MGVAGIGFSLLFICLFFCTMSQKPMQLGSPNLAYKMFHDESWKPFIFWSEGQRSILWINCLYTVLIADFYFHRVSRFHSNGIWFPLCTDGEHRQHATADVSSRHHHGGICQCRTKSFIDFTDQSTAVRCIAECRQQHGHYIICCLQFNWLTTSLVRQDRSTVYFHIRWPLAWSWLAASNHVIIINYSCGKPRSTIEPRQLDFTATSTTSDYQLYIIIGRYIDRHWLSKYVYVNGSSILHVAFGLDFIVVCLFRFSVLHVFVLAGIILFLCCLLLLCWV